MIVENLKRFLEERGVSYVNLAHEPAFTSQEEAARIHVTGYAYVKVVVVKLDGRPALAAVPAARRVDFKALAKAAGATKCRLVSEDEFQSLFPDCEAGAMPPFGNLYNMPTYVDEELSRNQSIVFAGGTHAESVKMDYADFERLAQPVKGSFAVPPPMELRMQKAAARRRGVKPTAPRARKKKRPKPVRKKARKKAKKKTKKKAARKKKRARRAKRPARRKKRRTRKRRRR